MEGATEEDAVDDDSQSALWVTDSNPTYACEGSDIPLSQREGGFFFSIS